MRIINQPNTETLGAAIQDILMNNHSHQFDSFKILVAYAKKSGVIRLKPAILHFKETGGNFKAVIGIDQRNTSFQALQTLYELSDEITVFHNESFSQTFHTKLYLFEKQGVKAIAFIGSSNLTAGGLFTNHELDVMINLDLSVDEQRREYETLQQLFNECADTTTLFSKRVTNDLLQELLANNYLGNEEVVSGRRSDSGDTTEPRERLFGAREIRPPSAEGRNTTQNITNEDDTEVEIVTTPAQTTGTGFWKQLSNNDVSLTSSPGQIIIPIRFLSMFPPFTAWQTTSNGARQADVSFNLDYIDSDQTSRRVHQARAIHYVPAPNHPRQNQELRFTFHDRRLLERLNAGDILEFHLSNDPNAWFVVKLLTIGSTEANNRISGRKKFDTI